MIRLISDSSTLYSIEEGKKINCDITPLSVTINNQSYREYEDITSDQFIELINQGHIPSSSQPAMGRLIELIESYPEDEILIISMADGLSGTYQTAEAARLHCANPERIHVVNCKTLCGPHRYLVQLASKMIAEGKKIDEILQVLHEKIESCFSFLLPQDFSYLKRGGRCTPLAATMGGLLKIQPIMTQSEDGTRLEKFGIGRSFDSAIRSIIKEVGQRIEDRKVQISISHAANKEKAQKVMDQIQAQFPQAQCVLYDLSCAFITQGGPLCIAVQAIDL